MAGLSHVQPLQFVQAPSGILQTVRAMTPEVGNFPPLPGIFPDYAAPVIRTNAAGERELIIPAS